MNSALVYVMDEQCMTYQLLVLHSPLVPKFGEPLPLTLKHPALHLFICHKLQRAIAHTYQCERRAAVKPVPTLITVDRVEPAWSIRIDGGRNSAKRGHVLQRPLCAAGEFGGVVKVRTLTTHIGFVRMAVMTPKRRRRRRRKVKRVSSREARRMRTCFGIVEEVLGGRKGLVGSLDGSAVFELVITSCKREGASAKSNKRMRP